MKRFLIVVFLLLFSNNLFSFNSSIISFKSKGGDIIINLKKAPNSYDIAYYNYGVNFFVKGIVFNNLIIKKFDDQRVVRILPLTKNQSLIKIQYPIKDLRQHVQIVDANNTFSIIIRKNIPVPDVKAKPVAEKEPVKQVVKQPVVKHEKTVQKSDSSMDKSVVDVAKEFSLLQKNNKNYADKPKETSAKKSRDDTFNLNLNNNSDEYNFSKNAIKTYAVLFILCLFIIGFALIFRKFRTKLNFSNANNLIKVIYKQQIMPKKSIIIIKVFEEYYILGVTDSNFSVIDRVTHDSLKDEIKLIESKREKDKFINYLEKEAEQPSAKNKTLNDKEKLIKLIQNKLKNYNNNMG